jgi:hypothetical protein
MALFISTFYYWELIINDGVNGNSKLTDLDDFYSCSTGRVGISELPNGGPSGFKFIGLW